MRKVVTKRADEPQVAIGQVTLPGNGFTIPVPEQLRACLGAKVGKHVVLGIRPEHLALTDHGGESINVKLNVVEPLGNDMDLYLETALHPHVVAQGGSPWRPGGVVAGEDVCGPEEDPLF